jgi:hypothetical protein
VVLVAKLVVLGPIVCVDSLIYLLGTCILLYSSPDIGRVNCNNHLNNPSDHARIALLTKHNIKFHDTRAYDSVGHLRPTVVPACIATICMLSPTIAFTFDHRTLRTRLPVRSALFKQRTGGLVVRWVTTGESPLLNVFSFFALHVFWLPNAEGVSKRRAGLQDTRAWEVC